jgi:hypothetical protein
MDFKGHVIDAASPVLYGLDIYPISGIQTRLLGSFRTTGVEQSSLCLVGPQLSQCWYQYYRTILRRVEIIRIAFEAIYRLTFFLCVTRCSAMETVSASRPDGLDTRRMSGLMFLHFHCTNGSSLILLFPADGDNC